MKKLNLNAIRIDGGTQPRERINMEAVGDYAEAVKVGIEFPPVIVFHDGAEYWLADGFHRLHAHKQAGKASIEAEVRSGTLLDAKLYAVGANGAHGLRRTNEDKRKAVGMVLEEPAWKGWSDSKIAKVCGVSDKTVTAVRAAIFGNSEDAKTATRTVERAGKQYQQDTSNIGKKAKAADRKAAAPPAAPPPPEPDADELAEAQHTITDLAQENETLRDKLAVEAMDASEDEKTQASETIRELRALVKTLEAELDAVKGSRDTYMREGAEAKKDAIYWRGKFDKLQKSGASA